MRETCSPTHNPIPIGVNRNICGYIGMLNNTKIRTEFKVIILTVLVIIQTTVHISCRY